MEQRNEDGLGMVSMSVDNKNQGATCNSPIRSRKSQHILEAKSFQEKLCVMLVT